MRALKTRALRAAFDRFHAREWTRETPRAPRASRRSSQRERAWLDDLALYATLRESHGGWGWTTGPRSERDRSAARARRGRARATPRRLLEVAYVQWTLHEQWDAARTQDARARRRADGRPALRRRAARAPTSGRTPRSSSSTCRSAPRPTPTRPTGRTGGFPPYDWLAMEADDLAWIRARTRHAAQLYDRFRLDHVVGLLPPVGEAQGRRRARSLRSRGRGRAVRARAAACSARCSRSSSRANHVAPPRALAEDLGVIPPFVRDVAARARDAGLPRPAVGEGRRRALPRSAVVPAGQHRLVEHARHARPSSRGGTSCRSDDRAQSSARAPASRPDDGRARAHARAAAATSTARAPTSRSCSRQELLGAGRSHQHAGDGRRAQLELAPAAPHRGPARRTPRVMARFDAVRALVDGVGAVAGTIGRLGALPAHAARTGAVPPARRHVGRARRQLRALQRARDRRRALPLRRARGRDARCPFRWRTLHVWHVYVPGLAPRAALRLARARPLRARARGTASTRTSSSSIRTRARSTARSTRAAPSTRYRRDRAPRRPRRRRSRRRRRQAEVRRRRRRASTGATTARRASPGATRCSTSCTSRASPGCTPACPSRSAARTSGSRRTPAIAHLQGARRDDRRAHAGARARSTSRRSRRAG